ncbi:MAG: serine/threonine protein kinase [Myxococcales bacterium]|nr:serine/threonine protein kinase [Myxococcales bacterium]
MAEARAQNSYRVTERLESGGMAEVFRGESTSMAGFKKLVAIKRVLPHLASNEKFIRMFLDEARLSARLSHANIVQVFDIGRVEGTYFIVMEFIDGINLKGVIEYLRSRKETVSLALAVHICVKVCEGLFYAHELTETDGRTLGIVHRDISPPNVLISRRGEVKIVDFGLAKAAHSVEKTEPGVVKGKFSYLAPETASGQEADAQADLYAVGIMLWEMLAGRKLFQGETDFATVKMVQQSQVPPLREFNKDVPEDLLPILEKALARDKRARYRTAQEMGDALQRFLALNRMFATASELGDLVSRALEEKARAARSSGRNDAGEIDKIIQEMLGKFTSIDDTSMGGVGPSELLGASMEGARPLDADNFVDVNNWASDLVTEGRAGRATGGAMPALERPSIPLGLADELEGPDLGASGVGTQKLGNEKPNPPPTSLVHASGRGAFSQLAPPPPPPPKKFPVLVVVAVLGVLAAAAAGLHFAGVF